MSRFSERIGLIKPRSVIQKDGMDTRLKNRLWSQLDEVFWSNFGDYIHNSSLARMILRRIQDDFFGNRVDTLSNHVQSNIEGFRGWCFSAEWNQFYDFIQFMADFSKTTGSSETCAMARMYGEIFISKCDTVLANEKAAYRFISGDLCQITDETEIATIEEALSAPDRFSTVRMHLSAALVYYSDRDAPDYRNSIKESISALESALYCINGERSANLVKAIDTAEKSGLNIHGALKKGILSIYGWTSDEAGVRHALFEGDAKVDENEAKLMLVMCSALANYLIAKIGQ